jgi:hypothetical protein
MEIEGGRWMVLVAGAGHDYPPTDEKGYLAFAKSLPDSVLYESIQKATPLSDIYGYRPGGNRFRHYEHATMPQNFIVIGDAVCTFNPLYGQGVTVAALEAQLLDRCLCTWHRRNDPVRHFQKQIAQVLASPWMLATADDSAPQGRKSLREKVANWYVAGHVIPAIPKDAQVQRTFVEIVNMVRSPNALLHPAIVGRVLVRR